MSQRAPPTDLELTHYQQRVPRKEGKKGKKFGAWYLATQKKTPTTPCKTFVRITGAPSPPPSNKYPEPD